MIFTPMGPDKIIITLYIGQLIKRLVNSVGSKDRLNNKSSLPNYPIA